MVDGCLSVAIISIILRASPSPSTWSCPLTQNATGQRCCPFAGQAHQTQGMPGGWGPWRLAGSASSVHQPRSVFVCLGLRVYGFRVEDHLLSKTRHVASLTTLCPPPRHCEQLTCLRSLSAYLLLPMMPLLGVVTR